MTWQDGEDGVVDCGDGAGGSRESSHSRPVRGFRDAANAQNRRDTFP